MMHWDITLERRQYLQLFEGKFYQYYHTPTNTDLTTSNWHTLKLRPVFDSLFNSYINSMKCIVFILKMKSFMLILTFCHFLMYYVKIVYLMLYLLDIQSEQKPVRSYRVLNNWLWGIFLPKQAAMLHPTVSAMLIIELKHISNKNKPGALGVLSKIYIYIYIYIKIYLYLKIEIIIGPCKNYYVTLTFPKHYNNRFFYSINITQIGFILQAVPRIGNSFTNKNPVSY